MFIEQRKSPGALASIPQGLIKTCRKDITKQPDYLQLVKQEPVQLIDPDRYPIIAAHFPGLILKSRWPS